MNIQELRTIPVLSDLPEKILFLLADMLEEKLYADSAMIFNEGAEGNTFYIIKSGEIVISTKKRTLATLQSGDFFGEMSLIDQRPRSATAVAKGIVTLYALNSADFQELMQADSAAVQIFVFHLLETVIRRLRQTDRELIAVYEIGKILSTTLDLKEVASSVLVKIGEEIEPAEYGLISLWNEVTEEFELCAAVGYSAAEIAAMIFPLADPVIKALVSQRQHLYVKNWEKEYSATLAFSLPFHGRSLLASPFLMQERCRGFIILTNKNQEHAFTLDQLNMLAGISTQISIALENLKHLEEEKAFKRLKDMQTGYR